MVVPTMQKSVRRVLLAQAVLAFSLIALALLASAFWHGSGALAWAKGVAFGSFLGIATTAITVGSVLKSSRAARDTPHLGMLPLYSGLLFKFLLVAGGAFFGLVRWELGPLPVVLGYVVMQAGYAWAAFAPDR